ncbi:tRNA modification GTPase TrmE [Williamsoniiplasma luminosum]|uniref:tRNA modification GTPase MnmE n=1 Tax=Williamsoniiplasma luminosum TaxID=214888 RepID=A0A2K8NTL8_9MOLU|nr:tRNA uridine-5-carboxymethylaminomethyl(34) synthesis GTPase MnmE [Williamsoniiplasma luminosum]ATZ16906.1 tRNA modification GTPase TrmE [Williamsoniiplasma luminosum]
MQINITDTIVAPATTIATQAIALIRISGDDALKIFNRISPKNVPHKKGIYVRKIYDQQNLVDEVVVNAYFAPESFTGENVVEIACHGGVLNTNRIIKLILNNGARMALKGEFSQRSFLNNKINLIQAEGINDLIHASNDLALKIGVDNMSGSHNKAILSLKNDVMDIISRIQVLIDYPEYDDIEGSSNQELIEALEKVNHKVTNLLIRSQMASKSIEGIKTAIVGKTNVGKSSLLNALINEDKAIVTDIHGTTRDVVEGQINLNGVTINLIDTAGIRETKDVVELIGIQKSKDYINQAEFVFFVVNAKQMDDLENVQIFKLLENKNHILIINKADELSDVEQKELLIKYPEAVFTSALNDDIGGLINKIKTKYDSDQLLQSNELILININQINLIEQIKTKLETALNNINNYLPVDIINVDLYDVWGLLGELTGEQMEDEILDNIFRKYCLGK